MITKADLDNWFTYHSPTEDQIPKYVAIRDAGKQFALVILQNTPPSADQSSAIRHIRNAVMEANASIACDEGSIRRVDPMDNQVKPTLGSGTDSDPRS